MMTTTDTDTTDFIWQCILYPAIQPSLNHWQQVKHFFMVVLRLSTELFIVATPGVEQ
jgi:hypothetical protein